MHLHYTKAKTPLMPNARAIYQGIKRCIPFLTYPHAHAPCAVTVHANKLLLGLSLRFSYSHLLFNPTLALPVDGVGVPGVALLELSPNKLLLMGLPPYVNRCVAEPPSAFWNSGLPALLGEKGELEVDRARLGRGLPVAIDCEL